MNQIIVLPTVHPKLLGVTKSTSSSLPWHTGAGAPGPCFHLHPFLSVLSPLLTLFGVKERPKLLHSEGLRNHSFTYSFTGIIHLFSKYLLSPAQECQPLF